MWTAVAIMAVAAATWLGYETYRFFRQPQRIGTIPIHPGAIDLRIFHATVTTWFSGKSIFAGHTAVHAVYPPASMALLWPLYGWRSIVTATIVWWLTVVPALVWLVRIAVRESGARAPSGQAFAALLPLAIYPTGAIVGNGQVTLHVLAALVGGLMLLREPSRRWGRDVLAALLILFALVKPTVAAPFFWIVLFAARGLRPAVIVGVGYATLTVAAAAFQSLGTIALVRRIAGAAATLGSHAGESNLHSLLAWLGRPEWMAAASIAVFLLLGLWVWRHRDGDWWLLMGVCAIAARFWTYHRWYDDLLLLLPMIALYRAARGGTSRGNVDVAAGVLLALTLAVMIAPGGRYLLPAPWDAAWGALQVAIWIADLALLLAIASAAGPGGRSHSVGVPPGA